MKIALIALAGLAAAFVLTPVAQERSPLYRQLFPAHVHPDEPKSGLRYAVEGRLRWLGVL
jgi:hypothetical protein